jgi:hypothetical protein
MGYNLHKDVIERMKSYLDAMASSSEDVEWATDDPMLAYRIREAIASAKYNRISQYSGLSSKFIVRLMKGKVVAQLRDRLSRPFDSEEAKKAMSRVVLHDVTSMTGIVGAAISNKVDELYFPNVLATDKGSLDKLYNWNETTKSGYLIVDHVEAGITLTKNKQLKELAYVPNP